MENDLKLRTFKRGTLTFNPLASPQKYSVSVQPQLVVEEISLGSNPNSWDPVFLRALQSLSFSPSRVLHMETLHPDDLLLANSLPDSTLGFYQELFPAHNPVMTLVHSSCLFLFLKLKISNGSCRHVIFAQNPASNSPAQLHLR